MYKVIVVDPFYDEILKTELPIIPSINESIGIWQSGALIEFDVKAVTYHLDKKNNLNFVEICVEQGEG